MISLNLLPFERKEIFRWRQNTKKAISSGIKIIFLLIFFAAPLGAIDFYLTEKIKSLDDQIKLSENTETMRQLNLTEKSFKQINNALININKISEGQIYWRDVFSSLSAIMPPDIQIFSLQIGSDGFFSVIGRARNREDVLELEKRFKNSADFSNIQMPLDNLIKRENISLSFSGNIILDNFKGKK